MMRALIVALISLCCLTLTGCGILFRVRHLDVQQGNVITPDMVAKLHKGMSRQQVITVLGDPVLQTLYENKTLEYVYTWQPGYGKMTEKRLVVLFYNGRLSNFKQTQFTK